jgi:hypothetical protein
VRIALGTDNDHGPTGVLASSPRPPPNTDPIYTKFALGRNSVKSGIEGNRLSTYLLARLFLGYIEQEEKGAIWKPLFFF